MKNLHKDCEELRRQIAQKNSEITDHTILLTDKRKKFGVTTRQHEELTHTLEGLEVDFVPHGRGLIECSVVFRRNICKWLFDLLSYSSKRIISVFSASRISSIISLGHRSIRYRFLEDFDLILKRKAFSVCIKSAHALLSFFPVTRIDRGRFLTLPSFLFQSSGTRPGRDQCSIQRARSHPSATERRRG